MSRRLILPSFLAIATWAMSPSAVHAQFPGLPVLQNAWATPGLAAGLNAGGNSDGSAYAAAAAWSPTSTRLQLTAGVGYQDWKARSGRFAAGGRVMVPLGARKAAFRVGENGFGFAAFAGAGGGPARTFHDTFIAERDTIVNNGRGGLDTLRAGDTTVVDSTTHVLEIPAGVSIGYRRRVGTARALSVYATPAWVFYTGSRTNTDGRFRCGFGLDFAFSQRIGATLGLDVGWSRRPGMGGPSSTQWALGAAYALGNR